MPRRTDINKILIIGSGPIVIGQACEFDYSGTQGCKALREEGYRVVLVNSNPATIMTDPEFGDRTYVEPITAEVVERIIAREKPDCLLPTLGGQTALNVTVELYESGALDRHKVEIIGANFHSIKKAEDRDLFRSAMANIGLEVPRSGVAVSLKQAIEIIEQVGFPAIIRPSFTLGGEGAGVSHDKRDFRDVVEWGLQRSPRHQILIEQSVLGWKEYELEVMRDLRDNVVVICSIENLDPMGIHTGDSITVAPIQTLTDKEYQSMRDAAIAVIREIGVETGGSNIQFAVHPESGKMVVIEMNPRVSRSSALASKATGFPIAKIAAKLAVGFTLDEIPNDITKETPASFEPTIDYCVVKIPRWTFEKFPGAQDKLGTQMKSVGETMAIGRTFKEALQKGLRSLEIGRYGFGADGKDVWNEQTIAAAKDKPEEREAIERSIREHLSAPTSQRCFYLRYALQLGIPINTIFEWTGGIDPWFLANLQQILEMERCIRDLGRDVLRDRDDLFRAKATGFSDQQLGFILRMSEEEVRQARESIGVRPVYKTVDTCGAEFEAFTPYHYSTYEQETEVRPCEKKKVIILGSGPNRIGQGIEFDYCCVHCVQALQQEGFETIMVNSNPETVSTDYDTADRLYFEPLTLEDVLNIYQAERPLGVIVQFGGQTPLNLAVPLERAGVRILGTQPDSIDISEDRERFAALLRELEIPQPPNGCARSVPEALAIAAGLGYPVLVRPSYVLAGRAMEIVFTEDKLRHYMAAAARITPDHPVLVDKFLEDAIEVDVDCVCDGREVYIGGIMEHIEYAGVHSGDSACVIPPRSLTAETQDTIKRYTKEMAVRIGVIGLMNVQYAVTRKQGEEKVYVLEANPRASRTVPYVSKATGVALAKVAAKVIVGRELKDLGLEQQAEPSHVAVKEVVLPFSKFPGVDTILGPEMRSTGEVMGIDTSYELAFLKAQLAASQNLPKPPEDQRYGDDYVFVSVADRDKPMILGIAKTLVNLGFRLVATDGTNAFLAKNGVSCQRVFKVNEGIPNVVEMMTTHRISLVINTPLGAATHYDEKAIRRAAVEHRIPYVTTIASALATVEGMRFTTRGLSVCSLQEFHARRR
ncbi:MAG: carbamoyl-phosphate synthase large subunit [Deltaproteobacteria bacterium]|nr:carbamoyl-phosphate synthase large subunit [Deltaproteobacteria bacterium]